MAYVYRKKGGKDARWDNQSNAYKITVLTAAIVLYNQLR